VSRRSCGGGDLKDADHAWSWLSAFVRNWGLAVRNKHGRRALYAAIDELPDPQPILRSWARNRSLAAIARELEMPAATVRSHKSRAIADLRKRLAPPPEQAVKGSEVQRNRISRT